MLTVYKRHSADCPQTSRSYRRCDCPCWAEGTIEGKYFRESLKTRSWTRASEIIRERENGHKVRKISIQEATSAFISDAEARGLRPPSVYKYKLLFKQLKAFAEDNALDDITECDVETLRKFRESWPNKNYSAKRKLNILRTFFKFVQESGWLDGNPAKLIKPPKTEDAPTLPYTRGEFARILAACDKYPARRGIESNLHLRAMALLLRYSGLRISDAVSLMRQRVTDGVLVLRTAKTGQAVRVPLPEELLEALGKIKIKSDVYYFWSGHGLKKTRVGNYQHAFKKVYEIAQVQKGHAHRMRDTFAVELLLAGVSLDQVAALLGHSSTRITEKHYSPWVKARQEQLEEAVRKTF